ncbi:DNA-3-methyladenine glycosylase [Pelagicoccus albus]|uniref:Putative 3-methyladenine DNA glycosylase n=2 Tax=Pelagicoccus albus TaxID=415222 RepID=A0A7X1B7K5_9BACT|nr:DNA-3-methyladenine glycosylase [Pelagicoccus albus]
MARILKPAEFTSADTVRLARELIGKQLVRTDTATRIVQRLRIIETEAYDGPEDLACHASKGRTTRTEVMFGPAGHWYVYLIYGMHQMLNLVTGPQDYPAAILIRGLESVSGPGRLTKRLGIGKELNSLPAKRQSGLHLEDAPRVDDALVKATPRIGIDYAGPDWSQRPYRFVADLA